MDKVIYRLVLFIGFICLLVLFTGFGSFIYWIYLLALVLAYTVSNLIAISFRFSQRPERNIFTFLSLYISQVLMEKIFRFPLRCHSCLTKLPLLQLHNRPSLIKLTNITSLHHNHNTCSILTLHYSNITSHYLVFIHLQFHSDFQLPHLPSTFVSLARRYVHILSPTTYGMLWNYYFFPATSKLIQDWDQTMKTQFSAPYAPKKLTKVFSKIWHWHAPTKTAIHDVIKYVMVYISAKLVMQKILAALSPGNVLNKALELPKCYPTCASLSTSKSSLCCWKILLRLQKSYPHSCRSSLPLGNPIMWCFSPFSNVLQVWKPQRSLKSTRSFHPSLALSSPLFIISNYPSIITTWQLTTSSHIAITEFILDQGLSIADAKSSKEKCQVLYCSMLQHSPS